MNRSVLLAIGLIAVGMAAVAAEPARNAIVAAYSQLARSEDSAFKGFSTARGERLYLGPHTGGNTETPACATCHTADPRAPGRHVKTGRAIEPIAVSVNPRRFTDAADVEKRFARDCPNVLGRPCTAAEKGDFLTFLINR